MLRGLDIVLSMTGLVLGAPVLVIIYIVGIFETGSPLFRQKRVGRDLRTFTLLKFRTMRIHTESVATHLVDSTAVTSFGRVLRKTKLDELPQLWNVLCGEMSLVGPRPCLPNQHELIAERYLLGVFKVCPGITGLAQVRGIDMSTPVLLAKTDAEMLKSLSVYYYFLYISVTLLGKGRGDRLKENEP